MVWLIWLMWVISMVTLHFTSNIALQACAMVAAIFLALHFYVDIIQEIRRNK